MFIRRSILSDLVIIVAISGLTTVASPSPAEAGHAELPEAPSEKGDGPRVHGLRGFDYDVGISDDGQYGRRELQQTACYTCTDNNPCPNRQPDDKFYFAHCDPLKFVQCNDVDEDACWDMPCAPGTRWYQDIPACCAETDLDCQDPDNRVTCGTKPSYDHQRDIWPPENTTESLCNANSECKSCCCGRYNGGYQVCTNSDNRGQGLDNVCPEQPLP